MQQPRVNLQVNYFASTCLLRQKVDCNARMIKRVYEYVGRGF